jgi:hypothetical protein
MKRNLTTSLVAAILLRAVWLPPAAAQDAVYTPAQVAFLNAEIKKAQGRFAVQVAAISGVPAGRVLKMMPTDWRAGDPKFVVIPALERERGARLSDEQRQQISAADREMKDSIARARTEATKR